MGQSQSRIKALRDAGKLEEALKLAREMAGTARAAGDPAGEAAMLVHQGKALEELKRPGEAADAWLGAAALWEKAGYTPSQLEALWRGYVLLPSRSERARGVLDQMVKSATAEQVRPRQCATACRIGGEYLYDYRRILAAQKLYAASLALYERANPDSMSVIEVLVGLSRCHEAREEFSACEEALQRAIAHAERVSPGSRHLAPVLSERAQVLARAGRLAEAEKAYQRALDYVRQADPDSLAHGSILRHYGDLFSERGREIRAEQLYLESLGILDRRAPKSITRANTLEVLGSLAARRGQFTTAEQYLARAVQLRREIHPRSYDLSRLLLTLATHHQQFGQWEAARGYLQEAAQIRQQVEPESRGAAGVWMQFGNISEAAGELKRAAGEYERARAIYAAIAPGKEEHGWVLIRLGNVDYRRGNLHGAWSYLSQAVVLLEKSAPTSYSLGEGLYRLSNVALDRGDVETGAALLERARGLVTRTEPRSVLMVQILINLGTVAALEGKSEEARGWLVRARDLLHQTADRPELLGRVLTRLAGLELEARRPDKADPLLAESLRLLEPLPRHGTVMALALHATAECREQQGRNDEAEALYRRSLEVWAKRAPRWPARARTLYQLARRVKARGDRKEAVQLAEQAWTVLQNQAQELSGDETLLAYEQSRAPIAAGIAGLLVGENQFEKALQVVDENRARALQHLLAEDRERPAGVSDTAWDEFCGARSARATAEARVVEAGDWLLIAEKALTEARKPEGDAAARAQWETRVGELRKELEHRETGLTSARAHEGRLWDQLQGEVVRPAVQPTFTAQLQQAKRLASAGTAVAYFSVGDEETQLFLLCPPGKTGTTPVSVTLRSFRIPLGQVALGSRVQECVKALRQQRSEGIALSRELCRSLFPGSALEALRQAKRIVLVPDGSLWALPFGVLALPEPAPTSAPVKATASSQPVLRFLGLEKPLSSAPSLALFVQSQASVAARPSGRKVRVLAIGDPVLKTPGQSLARLGQEARPVRSALPWELNLPPLPGTRQDATAVASIYGASPLVGDSATEPAARAALPTSDIIHLSTHGYVHPYWTRASGVVLSRPADTSGELPPGRDGILQAWELYGTMVTRADLVVLAACETGLGEIVRGEGVNGLVRAFLGTGARSVVASHWKVRDDSTRELMIAFHRAIRAGVPKDEALSRAMRQIQARPGWAHPYYWGAFALTGAPENALFKPAAVEPTRPPGRSQRTTRW